MNINELYDKLVKSGEDWAEKEAAASLLEESKKAVIAQIKVDSAASSDAAKETEALASAEYIEHVEQMVKARKAANVAKVNYEAQKTYVDLKRTAEANKRAEMRL